ncbi:MAG: pitrilysin family protein [Flavobacteriales bacterium]|nr:pitrilysin family protein [Flavobacteriales bacterium]
MNREFSTHVLPNGLRIIHAWMPREVTHCALAINAGTRDEGEGEAGLAHFIEHVLFKGTHKRKAFHILNRMESVGGEINAYTTKEDTWITSSQRAKDTERALELLADIAFRSTFPEAELDKERDVILDEIAGVQDQPGDMIFEDFEARLFAGHALSQPILGTAESVKALSREQVAGYVAHHYRPDNMVLGVVGAVTWERVVAWAERHFGDVPTSEMSKKVVRTAPSEGATFGISEMKGIHQVHHLTGAVAPGGDSRDKLPMTVLANILGGPAMNCRLNLNIREKHGMAYHIEANHVVYQDAGVFNVYFGTDARFHGKVERLVRKELKAMRTKALGMRQLHDAKQQLLGQIALGHDHGATVLSGLAKTYLMYDRVETLDSLIQAIEALTAQDLMEVANTWLPEEALSHLTFTTPRA